MLAAKIRRNILRIIPFGVIWLLFGFTYSILEKGILGDLDHYPATGNPYDFGSSTLVFLIFVPIAGLLIGTFEVLYLDTLFNKEKFLRKIFYKTVIYLFVIISFLMIAAVITNSIELDSGLFDEKVLDSVWVFFTNEVFWGTVLYASLAMGVSLFYSEVSENLGLSVLNNLFAGKYNKPVEEERIFMFLDMKSSTAIAEELGHVKYFEMLREYYADLTDPIINYAGEIYQYVGDEIVVTWTPKNGLHNNNCLHCFFAMKKTLAELSKKYHAKFGVHPTFKAGFHLGKVTTGEIGVVKKDIIFTGDVLNTTARIQGLCNNHDAELLISADLKNRLQPSSEFQFTSIGKNELRGRNEEIELFGVVRS